MVEYFVGFCPCSLTKCIANGAPDFAWDKGRSGKSFRIFHWAEIHCALRWNKTKDMVVKRAVQVEETECVKPQWDGNKPFLLQKYWKARSLLCKKREKWAQRSLKHHWVLQHMNDFDFYAKSNRKSPKQSSGEVNDWKFSLLPWHFMLSIGVAILLKIKITLEYPSIRTNT